MSHTISSPGRGEHEWVNQVPVSASLVHRVGLFVVFLGCALAIFAFGANYYKLFPTNGNSVYAATLSVVFLTAVLWLRRRKKYTEYGPITYAFFVASVVNLISSLFAGYNSALVRSLGMSIDTNEGLAIGKLYDTLLVVLPIIALTKLSGADLGSLFLTRGDWKWGLGVGVLVLFNFLTSVLIFFAPGYDSPARLGSAIIWGAVFAFGNGFLEELWFRGLFLKKLAPLIGSAGTVLVTSVWFGAIHMLAVAYLPSIVIPIFLVNAFTLGLACGYLMLRTGSIWGSVLIHAAADWFLFIAVLATH